MKHTSESGNVLFLILIAAALFAALSYAVTQSSRSGGGATEREGYNLAASEISNYATAISAAVTRLIATGCSSEEISFYTPTVASTVWYQHTPEVDDECKIFHPSGAGVPYQFPSSKWLDPDFSAQNYYGEYLMTSVTCIPQVGTGTDDTCQGNDDETDLILFLPFISQGICEVLSDQFDTKVSSTIIQDGANAFPAVGSEFTGTYTGMSVLHDPGTQLLWGTYTGCFEGDTFPPSGSYTFYHVLLAR